jgi:hypothetical protein
MGKQSRIRNLGVKYRERIAGATVKLYNEHTLKEYPYDEEDSEGISHWFNPKLVKLEFKGLTSQQGYVKTMSKFKLIRMDKFIKCYIEDKYVVVELP